MSPISNVTKMLAHYSRGALDSYRHTSLKQQTYTINKDVLEGVATFLIEKYSKKRKRGVYSYGFFFSSISAPMTAIVAMIAIVERAK